MYFGVGQSALSAVFLLTAALAGSGCATARALTAPPPGPARLAVVTWNMNAGRGDLPGLVRDIEEGRLVGAPAGDVVLLLQEAVQEAASELHELAAVRGWSAFFAPVHHDGARRRGNAIVSSRPLHGARAILLPRERQPRNAVTGAIAIDDQELFVVSTHLENRVSWWKAGFASDDARGRQAEALLRELPTEMPGIVGGDFNTWLGPGESAWRLFQRRFDDTPTAETPTFSGGLVLDHVFVDLPEGWDATTRVIPDRYRSDHHPVLTLVYGSNASSRAATR